MTETTHLTTVPLTLSTGIYDLLKLSIQKKRLTKFNEKKLEIELKTAKQVLRKDMPANVVDVNTQVEVKDLTTGEIQSFKLVSPSKARNKHQTLSIMSPIGVAMLGYTEGSVIEWEMIDGIRQFKIEKVSRLN